MICGIFTKSCSSFYGKCDAWSRGNRGTAVSWVGSSRDFSSTAAVGDCKSARCKRVHDVPEIAICQGKAAQTRCSKPACCVRDVYHHCSTNKYGSTSPQKGKTVLGRISNSAVGAAFRPSVGPVYVRAAVPQSQSGLEALAHGRCAEQPVLTGLLKGSTGEWKKMLRRSQI